MASLDLLVLRVRMEHLVSMVVLGFQGNRVLLATLASQGQRDRWVVEE